MIGAASKFKRGTGRDAHVVLIPQPSDDPNDPYVSYFLNQPFSDHYQHRLNWPRWKKEACFWTLYVVLSTKRPFSNELLSRTFGASLDGALAPLVSPGLVDLSVQFGVSVDEVASSFGSIVLGLACFM